MQNATANRTLTLSVTIIVRHFGHDGSPVTMGTPPTPLMGSLTLAGLVWVTAGSSGPLLEDSPVADGQDAITTTTGRFTVSHVLHNSPDLVSAGFSSVRFIPSTDWVTRGREDGGTYLLPVGFSAGGRREQFWHEQGR